MSWDFKNARERINELKLSTPTVNIQKFDTEYLPRFHVFAENQRAKGAKFDDKPLFNLKSTEGIQVDAVHVYANLVDFDDYLISDGVESEKSHERSLNFLHLHYSSCDRVVENCGAQRVDFHGGRMHAVILEPAGAENLGVRVAKAIFLADQLSILSSSVAGEIRGGDFSSKYRIGIDTGQCVAINSGRGLEPEPLFLGSAANHAAKLADGDEAGIFLSDKAQAALINQRLSYNPNYPNIDGRRIYRLEPSSLFTINQMAQAESMSAQDLLDNWLSDIRNQPKDIFRNPINFNFHAHKLPLRTLKYGDLMPSYSIRMGMISIFGDLDGYTNYIDNAMSNTNSLSNAVRNLHVIRGEMANVLQDDFKGRKVRFIGDCIHGVLCCGSSNFVDNKETIRQAIHCAGGLRSSFNLSKDELNDANSLGLAIGFELGETPITRLGIRGERSVRVASSISTLKSEVEQRRCDGGETAIGENAFSEASHDAKSFFMIDRKCSSLDYDSAFEGIHADVSSPAYIASKNDDGFRAHLNFSKT